MRQLVNGRIEGKQLRNLLGIQFFAEGQSEGGSDSSGNPEAGGNLSANPNQGEGNPEGKTFTQSDVQRMMANEKRTARTALLKELGFEGKDVKSDVQSIKAILDSQKTDAQRASDKEKQLETAKTTAENKAAMLECKLEAMKQGVTPEALDDVMTLAMSKVNEDTTLETVLKDLKSKYPAFFGQSQSNGTGNPINPPKRVGQEESLGQRLAKAKAKPATKSNYFKN